jgi:hypothetical protein
VPSADVAPKKSLFLEHESQFRPHQPGPFEYITQYTCLGVGFNTELDLTLINLAVPQSHNMSLGVGFKTAVPILKRKLPNTDLRLTFGELVPISLENQGVGNWSYAHLSGRLPRLKTRITAGVSTGTRQIFFKNNVCFIGGYEQPVTRRLSLQGDWFSGDHSLGYFIPGLSYILPGEMILYAGYQIPNMRRVGRDGFVVELAKNIRL